jgi:hypothetical protein
MDLERSRNVIKLDRLVQRIALLEADLRAMQGNAPLSERKDKPDVTPES